MLSVYNCGVCLKQDNWFIFSFLLFNKILWLHNTSPFCKQCKFCPVKVKKTTCYLRTNFVTLCFIIAAHSYCFHDIEQFLRVTFIALEGKKRKKRREKRKIVLNEIRSKLWKGENKAWIFLCELIVIFRNGINKVFCILNTGLPSFKASLGVSAESILPCWCN